jgi:hypothetical protein
VHIHRHPFAAREQVGNQDRRDGDHERRLSAADRRF